MPEVNITNTWGDVDFSSSMKVAGQICHLINSYNYLNTVYRPENILCRSKDYLALMVKGIVVGCLRIDKQSYTFTELRHLSVIKPFRGAGLGKLLVEESFNKINTPMVYVTIRSTNTPSLDLFGDLGFTIVRPDYLNEDNVRVCISIATTEILKRNKSWTSNVNIKEKEV